jgi:hypothetical protein
MYISRAPFLLLASLARQQRLSGWSSDRRLMASPAASQEPQIFPVWLRLKGMAPFADRQRVTTEVADSISISGGFLSRSNILSDMVTVMTLEDVQPHRIGRFEQKLHDIKGFRLDGPSTELLQHCQQLLLEQDTETKEIPPSVYCNLQITWVDAPGELRQEIPADG